MKVFLRWYKKLKTILTEKKKKEMLGLILLMVFVAVIETIATTLMLPFMNEIIDADSKTKSVMIIKLYEYMRVSGQREFLIRMSILISILYLLKGMLAYVSNFCQQRFVSSNRSSISGKLFDLYLSKPYSYHLNNTTSDIHRAVVTDVDWYCYFVNAFMTMLAETFIMVLILIMLLIVSPQITILAMIMLFATMIITSKFISGRVRYAGEQNRIYSAKMTKWIQQTIGALKNILINRKEEYFKNQFQNSVDEFSKYNCKYLTIFALPRILTETISMAGVFLLMTILLINYQDPQKLIPILATFAVAAVRLMPSAKRISDSLNQMKYYGPAIEKIADEIDVYASQKEENGKVDNKNYLIRNNSILINNLTFGFDDSNYELYKGFNLEIELNKSTAFIGQTGSGKTTLADLILGLHKPKVGDIIVKGKSIYKNKQWWANNVGYIPQMIYLCDDSIRKNVAFGVRDDEIDDEEVWHCIRQAQLEDFVNSLPDGINTITGENGIRLSGGQRQRIGIARALYNNPSVLVLDEATSALDNETEKAIMDAINSLSKEKTLIIIAHRLTTITNCDYIYEINKGKALMKN